MRILLINPSLQQAEVGHYDKVVEKNRGVYPPLGLGYIYSALEAQGHHVYLIDMDATPDASVKAITILKSKPDMICFYAMTWTFRQVCTMLEVAKANDEKIIGVIGGPHVNSFPKESLEFSKFDYAIQGEGEEALPELIDAIENKHGFENIDGLVWRKKGVVINRQRLFIKDINNIREPPRHIFADNNYWDIFSKQPKVATLIATRGCPYRCTFCDRKNRMGHEWRSRKPRSVVAEMIEIKHNYGVKEFMFFDDNFVINPLWIEEFCSLVKILHIQYEIRTRVDTVTPKLLRMLKNSGCYRIRYGMESGDDITLEKLRKDITVAQIKECAKITHRSGIELFAYFMLGSPGETKETLNRTLKLSMDINADYTIFSKTILIPNSELFNWAADNGYIKKSYWIDYLLGKETNPAPALNTEELPESVVDAYVNLANRKFYKRPTYIIKRILKTRSITQLIRQAKMARSI